MRCNGLNFRKCWGSRPPSGRRSKAIQTERRSPVARQTIFPSPLLLIHVPSATIILNGIERIGVLPPVRIRGQGLNLTAQAVMSACLRDECMESSPKRVFVSHAAADRAKIDDELLRFLSELGISIFIMPDNVLPGQEWEPAIVDGLRACTHFLVVLTPRAVTSGWVRYEVRKAFLARKQGELQSIIPIMFDGCSHEELDGRLGDFQFCEWYANPKKAKENLAKALQLPPRIGVKPGGVIRDFSDILSGSWLTGVFGGALFGLFVAAITRTVLAASGLLFDWSFGSWVSWLFGGAAVFSALGGLIGIGVAARTDRALLSILFSLLDRLTKGSFFGAISWSAAWVAGYFGGWEPYSWWAVILGWTCYFGGVEVVDSLLMLLECRALRRLNVELFSWNLPGTICVSCLWALARVAWGEVGSWGVWLLIGVSLFSVMGFLSTSIALSPSCTVTVFREEVS